MRLTTHRRASSCNKYDVNTWRRIIMKKLTVNSIATKLAISIPTLFALVYFGNMLGTKVNDKIGILALVVSFITIGIGSTIVQLVKTDMAVSMVTGMTFGAMLAFVSSLLTAIINLSVYTFGTEIIGLAITLVALCIIMKKKHIVLF